VSELEELARRVLDSATSHEQIEVYVSRGVETDVEVYQGSIEKLTTASSAGVGIRILHEGPGGSRVGTAWAGSLDETAIADALAQARDNVQFASEDEFVTFARPDGVAPATLELYDEGVATTPLDDKVALALELERVVRGADARIRQVENASYGDYVVESVLVSSAGISASVSRSGAFLSVEAIASDGNSDQTGYGLSAGRAPHQLDLDKAARDAVNRSTRMLGATRPTTRRTSVVFDPRTAATVLAIIGGALSGEVVVRGRSFFAGRVGESVASPLVSVVDDPTDPRHFAASRFDGEGLACRRNVLIDAGVLRGFVYDTVSARRAGTASTGSAVRAGIAGSPSAGVRALALAPGTLDQSEVFAAVGEGLYVDSLTGVHSGVNPISGDFSVGVTGLMIRDGQLAEPVREVTIASTLQRMLLDVSHVGADVTWLPGVAAGQTLAVADLSVSGS
jgi:PmbA protein